MYIYSIMSPHLSTDSLRGVCVVGGVCFVRARANAECAALQTHQIAGGRTGPSLSLSRQKEEARR